MRRIHKGGEPRSLRERRDTDGASHAWSAAHGTEKTDWLKLLCAEQRGLCVYCMSRVASDAHIEHCVPRAADEERTYDWTNLFASCSTREHCGTLKQDRSIAIDPLTDVGTRFLYTRLGEIVPTREDDALAQQAIIILGLNHERLVRNRKATRDACEAGCMREGYTAAGLRRIRGEWTTERRGELREYIEVALQYLDKKARQRR